MSCRQLRGMLVTDNNTDNFLKIHSASSLLNVAGPILVFNFQNSCVKGHRRLQRCYVKDFLGFNPFFVSSSILKKVVFINTLSLHLR